MEHVAGAVAVVHVPVNDHHPLKAPGIERVARGNGDVVEQAEAHRLRRERVMTRRSMRAERRRGLPIQQQVNHPDRSAGRVQRRLERPLADHGIDVQDRPARPTRPLDRCDVRVGMHRAQHRPIDRGRPHALKPKPAVRRELPLDHRDPPGVLRMQDERRAVAVRPGVVLERGRVFKKHVRHHKPPGDHHTQRPARAR